MDGAVTIDFGTAMLLIIAVIGANVLGELVKIFFQRMRTTDFVTKEDCQSCAKKGSAADDSLKAQLAIIRRLVVAMAIKMDVDTRDIQKLMD